MASATERVLSDQPCECGCGQYTFLAIAHDYRQGRRRGEPLRFRRGHNAVSSRESGRILKGVRYLERNIKIDKGGYGREGNHPAHRNYFKKYVGSIPDGYEIDHKCGQRACVNPEHLEAVTKSQNMWRMFMRLAGLSYIQIESLREWVDENLTDDQIMKLWSTNVER